MVNQDQPALEVEAMITVQGLKSLEKLREAVDLVTRLGVSQQISLRGNNQAVAKAVSELGGQPSVPVNITGQAGELTRDIGYLGDERIVSAQISLKPSTR